MRVLVVFCWWSVGIEGSGGSGLWMCGCEVVAVKGWFFMICDGLRPK